mmetsp:Transcript_1436/g.4340  ORF Transcript_1436/g.4340 Transcript_1436/m.4340 type:complete len:330 (-) Transcript_1436:465-1454(-)
MEAAYPGHRVQLHRPVAAWPRSPARVGPRPPQDRVGQLARRLRRGRAHVPPVPRGLRPCMQLPRLGRPCLRGDRSPAGGGVQAAGVALLWIRRGPRGQGGRVGCGGGPRAHALAPCMAAGRRGYSQTARHVGPAQVGEEAHETPEPGQALPRRRVPRNPATRHAVGAGAGGPHRRQQVTAGLHLCGAKARRRRGGCGLPRDALPLCAEGRRRRTAVRRQQRQRRLHRRDGEVQEQIRCRPPGVPDDRRCEAGARRLGEAAGRGREPRGAVQRAERQTRGLHRLRQEARPPRDAVRGGDASHVHRAGCPDVAGPHDQVHPAGARRSARHA